MSGYVYAIGIEGSSLIKIGKSKFPKKRLQNMQTGLPFQLHLVYSIEFSDEEWQEMDEDAKEDHVKDVAWESLAWGWEAEEE